MSVGNTIRFDYVDRNGKVTTDRNVLVTLVVNDERIVGQQEDGSFRTFYLERMSNVR